MFSFLTPSQEDYLTIPKSSLGYATNNKYPEIPPMMQDGRSVFASWQPQSIINDEIIKKNGLRTNWEYRQHMIKNGTQIMKQTAHEMCNDVGYYQRFVPEKIDETTNTKNYLAMKKMRENTDLKQIYFSREELHEIYETPRKNELQNADAMPIMPVGAYPYN